MQKEDVVQLGLSETFFITKLIIGYFCSCLAPPIMRRISITHFRPRTSKTNNQFTSKEFEFQDPIDFTHKPTNQQTNKPTSFRKTRALRPST